MEAFHVSAPGGKDLDFVHPMSPSGSFLPELKFTSSKCVLSICWGCNLCIGWGLCSLKCIGKGRARGLESQSSLPRLQALSAADRCPPTRASTVVLSLACLSQTWYGSCMVGAGSRKLEATILRLCSSVTSPVFVGDGSMCTLLQNRASLIFQKFDIEKFDSKSLHVNPPKISAAQVSKK